VRNQREHNIGRFIKGRTPTSMGPEKLRGEEKVVLRYRSTKDRGGTTLLVPRAFWEGILWEGAGGKAN